MSHDIQKASEKFAAAAERAERSWTLLRHDKFNPRLLIRHCRDLRRCERRRLYIKMIVETTTP